MKQNRILTLSLLCLLLFVVGHAPQSFNNHSAKVFANTPDYVEPEINYSGSIPTTSNPVGNGTTGLRTFANTSFEESDFACFTLPSGWAYINQSKMRGWLTAHLLWNETN